jgi:hypothetical protein
MLRFAGKMRDGQDRFRRLLCYIRYISRDAPARTLKGAKTGAS